MAIPQYNPLRDEIIDIKQKSLFARLKKLFSTDVIVRNVGGKQLKVKDTDSIQYATDRNTNRDRFNRIRSTNANAYSRDFSLAYQSARMDLFRDYDCVGAETVIPLPDGSRPTIKELAEKYKDNPQERFYVFSYDHTTDSIKLGKAYHPRKKKGTRQGYKVTFDDGSYIIGSLKHPFLMRDGSKKRLFELRVGDSVLPFYHKEYGYNKHSFRRYRRIYNFSKGWQSEHKIVAEQFYRPLGKNEVVHHKNFNGSDNTPENLQIMDWIDHKKFFGKKHSEKSNIIQSEKLKTVFSSIDKSGEKNPNYRSDITFDNVKQKAFEYYKEYSKINLWDFLKHIQCDHSTLKTHLKKEGHDWNSFKDNIESTLNHKVISIEWIGEIEVYDVTVEKYANFATDSCIVGNTMDQDPIISSVLDIYADESTTKNEMNEIITVHTQNNNVKKILENLYGEILSVQFNLWSWIRNMCKYGDFYLKLYVSPQFGVYMVEPISSYNVERIENSDPHNKRYVKFKIQPTDNSQSEVLENFEMAHFRLMSDSNFLPYGKSIIEGGRRVWKQLSLMEDAMMIHRIMRAPEKRIFYTDIGNIPPSEVDPFMERIISKMKKIPYMDESTGEYNLRFNLQNMVEDYYIPVRGGDSGTKIDTLGGMEWTGTEDIEYLKNKLMAALKVPKAFLGYEEGVGGKATLASEDVRFARTIQRIQSFVLNELVKIGIVHLYAQGYRDEALVDFELELTNPSTIFEQEKISIWSDKVDVATSMMESKLFSRNWIYKNIFKISEDDAKEVIKDVVDDAKERYRFSKIEDDGEDPSSSFSKIGGSSLGDFDDDDDDDKLKGFDDEDGDEGSGGLDDLDLGDNDTEDKEDLDKDKVDVDDVVKEVKLERDQSGQHNASDHPFGEDPLGKLELTKKERKNSEGKRKSAIRHNFEGGSPLRLNENEDSSEPTKNKNVGYLNLIQDLSELMNKTPLETKKELVQENQGSGSVSSKGMLDEGNILPE